MSGPQSPRFQSACGGVRNAGGFFLEPDRSPRDFRVLVADVYLPNSPEGARPQSPRFQSACGGMHF